MTMLADDHTEETDSDLIQKCQLGDENSFRVLYQRYQHKVRATLYKLCGSELLDDLTQDVFLKAWKALPKLREPSYFATWLYRICWNVACDRRRQLAKIRQQKKILEQSIPESKSIQGHLLKIHYQQLVQKALEHLTLDHRVVLVLHDLEDVPQKEIAQILSIPVGTVKSRLFNARKTMRQYLEQKGVTI